MRSSASSAANARWCARTRSSERRSTTTAIWPARPPTFKSTPTRRTGLCKDKKYTLQVAPEDCTGCGLCVEVCPVKDKSEAKLKAINMEPQPPLREPERANWDFFLNLPESIAQLLDLEQGQGRRSCCSPLFEFSGACSGCGETPYVKLMTQLFGDRLLIANATGCSSIYGGNLPTTPSRQEEGAARRGPTRCSKTMPSSAWACASRSTSRTSMPRSWSELGDRIGDELAQALLDAPTRRPSRHLRASAQRGRSSEAEAGGVERAEGSACCSRRRQPGQEERLDYRRRRLGLRHRLRRSRPRAGHRAAMSMFWCSTPRSTPTPAGRRRSPRRAARWPSSRRGKPHRQEGPGPDRHELRQRLRGHRWRWAPTTCTRCKAFLEAEAYDGPSLIIAYSHCIAHGFDMTLRHGAAEAGGQVRHWPLFRYNPELVTRARTRSCSIQPPHPAQGLVYNETRYTMLGKSDPEDAQEAVGTGRRTTCQPLEAVRARGAVSPPMGAKTSERPEQHA